MKTRRAPQIFLLAVAVILFQSQFSIHKEKVFSDSLLFVSLNSRRASLLEVQQQHTNKLLYLNQTTAETLHQSHRDFLNTKPNSTFDILSISSKFNLKLSHAQHETFASHSSVRNFIIATEDDDPDPTCYKTATMEDVRKLTKRCHNRDQYWQKQNAYNKLTKYLSGNYASFKWLQEKKNPTGWICAQKRFHSAFVKYMAMLEEHEDLIPDYLMIMDEDTYINVHDLEKYLITSDMSDKNDGYVPSSSETPVMFAGCRVRAPSHEIQFTFPFGGWGIYLSKGSLKKWLTPLDCDGNNGNKQSDHQELCLRYKTPFVNNATDTTQITIGEGRFFQNGMNLNQVFMRYIQEQQHYCLHGDWFFGYIANYLNMSRHVIPGTGQLPTVGYGGNRAKGFDDNEIGYNRLHTIMGSEQYGIPEGLCLYGNNGPPKYNEDGMEKEVHFYIPTNHLRPRHRKGWKRSQTCIYNTTICHYIKDPNDMKRLYTESENQRGFIYSFEDNT